MSGFKNNRDIAAVDFDLDFKAINYSKMVGSSFIFRAVPIYSDATYHQDENRKLPFESRFSFEDEYEIVYKLPAGYFIEEMPENGNINSDFGTYKISFEKKDDQLIVKRFLQMKKGLHPKEKYNDYIGFRKKIMNADNSKILISKKS